MDVQKGLPQLTSLIVPLLLQVIAQKSQEPEIIIQAINIFELIGIENLEAKYAFDANKVRKILCEFGTSVLNKE
jgi:hypothetical protein